MSSPRAIAWVLLMLTVGPPALAKGGVYDLTKHGDAIAGAQRLPSEPRGECSQCHDLHASRGGQPTAGPFQFALFAPNDNALCNTCHSTPPATSSYLGTATYSVSAHALSPAFVWPGPTPAQRPSGDWGKCVNCHAPHGVRDATGLVPSQLSRREESLCFTCHDGSPAATNVLAQVQRIYRHPISTVTGKHTSNEGADSTRYGQVQGNRHAECPDCHNPHTAKDLQPPPVAPAARGALANVSRIRVANGAAGSVPVYTFAASGDVSFPNEYEVCFKCHSSWTTQPPGQTNLAVVLNPNNPSFHPVQAPGTNPFINPLAFVPPWSATSTVYCSDCHGSDDPVVSGPHGSANRYILKAPYVASSGRREMTSNELCFQCHAFDTYGNRDGSTAAHAASRFNEPQTSDGHSEHVGHRDVPCYGCHTTHGSTTLPSLLVLGRSPGLNSYVRTANGGTCGPNCHSSESYQINYPR